MIDVFKTALTAAFIGLILSLPLVGIRTFDGLSGLVIETHWQAVWIVALSVCALTVLLGFIRHHLYGPLIGISFGILLASLLLVEIHPTLASILAPLSILLMGYYFHLYLKQKGKLASPYMKISLSLTEMVSKNLQSLKLSQLKILNRLLLTLILMAVIFPFLPTTNRYGLDVGITVLTYILLAAGLNITVGYAGLLDLGYVGFYAFGAYAYALSAQAFGMGFWLALPTVALAAVFLSLLLGLPVLRLRGDYFAVVTLGFGEIIRLIAINWTTLTGGPNGITGVARPLLFGLEFARSSTDGHPLFHDYIHADYDPSQRVYFLYFIILLLVLFVGFMAFRIRMTPLGRAWEAFREDEIACASLGISRWKIKLAAYALSASVASMAGVFFAARQGFISPESFTFTESAAVLAIVILGGIGHPLGIICASLVIIGLPELFRDLEQYRMLAFGLGLVLIMIWRPGGMMAKRQPTASLGKDDPLLSVKK